MAENSNVPALTVKQQAAQKRAETLALKKRQEAVAEQYSDVKAIIPSEWIDTPAELNTLVKTLHINLLGLDKEGQLRPLTDLKYFLIQAKQRDLNPFKSQIHAVYIWDSGIKAEKLIPITGIGGFRAIAQRSKSPLYAGVSEAEWEMDANDELPIKATVRVFAYNPVTGAREAISTGIAWFDEYKKEKEIWRDGRKSGEFELNATWKKMPKLMIAKCAEALAQRVAFPDDLSGLYIDEEIDHLKPERNIVEGDTADTSREDKIKAALEARNG